MTRKMSFHAARSAPLPPVAVTVGLWAVLAAVASVPLDAPAAAAVLALAVWRLLQRLRAPQPKRGAALVLLLPGIGFGAGGDGLWLAVAILALSAALDRRPGAMLGWYGLALGLSPHGLLLAPLMLALGINRRLAAPSWLVALMVALIVGLISGSPEWQMPTGYADGANLWGVAARLPWIGPLPLGGLALATLTGASAAFAAWFASQPLSGSPLVAAAAACTLAAAALAPGLGVDGWLPGGLLAFVLALTRRQASQWRIAASSQIGIAVALLGSPVLGAIALLVAVALLARAVLARAANDNALIPGTLRRTTAHRVARSVIDCAAIRGSSGEIGHVQ